MCVCVIKAIVLHDKQSNKNQVKRKEKSKCCFNFITNLLSETTAADSLNENREIGSMYRNQNRRRRRKSNYVTI